MQATDELLTAIESIERIGRHIRYNAMTSEAALYEDLHVLEEAVNQIHDELAQEAKCSEECVCGSSPNALKSKSPWRSVRDDPPPWCEDVFFQPMGEALVVKAWRNPSTKKMSLLAHGYSGQRWPLGGYWQPIVYPEPK